MKKGWKDIRRVLLVSCALTTMNVQALCMPMMSMAAGKGSGNSVMQGLLSDYRPAITESRSEVSGFSHPGIGMTKTLLDNMQRMIRKGTDPWSAYFEDMLVFGASSKSPSVKMTDPANTQYNSQEVNSKFITDALTAYTQAILYYVTGDNLYRKNALDILRLYEQLNPDSFAYFTDACIHTGIPMNRMCIGAEIIRYSSYEITDGYTEKDLAWTENDTNSLIANLIKPSVETFMSSPDNFMNQHLYTTIGAMSAYLFMDDVKGYAKTVEWFTVNKAAKNQGFNGSIKRLFREVTTLDEAGEKEGRGPRLERPVIEHVEMGRDQAHGCGDLTNAAILSRMMLGQGTRVDPTDGAVSNGNDAVDIYRFLDDRILKAADFFFRYMLGYDSDWIQIPFSMTEDGIIKDNYAAFSPSYRGRYNTINFWDIYTYYTYNRKDVDLKKDYPYFYEGFMKKVPSNYYWNGNLQVNWDNPDGGGDFWLFLPAEAENDKKFLADSQKDYLIQVKNRGSVVKNKAFIKKRSEQGLTYIRFKPSEQESKLAITSGGIGNKTIAFHIRTDGMAKLSLSNGVSGSIVLPDTEGKWKYVTFTRKDSEGYGDLYYMILSNIEGTYVDIDAIDIKPDTDNQEGRIDVLTFKEGMADVSLTTYEGAEFTMDCSAADSKAGGKVTYEGAALPQGVIVNPQNGLVEWMPDKAGTYTFYVEAGAGDTAALKKLSITVSSDRDAAIAKAISAFDENAVYVSRSRKQCEEELAGVKAIKDTAADAQFSEALNRLCYAVNGLELVSPLLTNDPLTAGDSLDYPRLLDDSTMGDEVYNWTDGDAGTFCGYYKAVDGTHILDFGPDFKIAAKRFGFQARLGFSDRLAGAQVFGSDDRVNWTQLTAWEAPFNQKFSTVDVNSSYQGNRYRYLMIKKTTEYPDVLSDSNKNLLEFGEFRIWGTRYETGK